MAKEVNIFTSDWTAVGTNANVPRYSIQVRHDWTDDAGVAHTETRTLTFPNALSGIPTQRLKNHMERIILEEARILLGINQP